MKKHHIGFSIGGSMLTLLFLIAVNLIASPNYLWFIYPSILLIFWPISIMIIQSGQYKLFSLFGSLGLFTYLFIINMVFSPAHPWFLYVIPPIICWPLSIFMGKKATSFAFAIGVSMSAIVYYSLLNLILYPLHPWAIYPAFAVMWWPISLYFVKKKNYFGLSLFGSLWTILFFTLVNLVSSPNSIWAIYPIFVILWWPLSIYYFQYKREERSKTI